MKCVGILVKRQLAMNPQSAGCQVQRQRSSLLKTILLNEEVHGAGAFTFFPTAL